MKKRISLLAVVACICMSAYAQKVFMTGDSHVSGKVYPEEVKKIIEKAKPTASFSYWGKGGAGFYTFNDTPSFMETIYKASPDVLVVHLGTNGCYNLPLDTTKYQTDIATFYTNVREKLPECKIVFVTPFYNRNRDVVSTSGKEKKYGPWKINEKTRGVADIIIEFAKDKPNTYVVDNNADAGSVFFEKPGLIRQDNIHLTVQGYELLGEQVAGRLLEIDELWKE